MSGSGIKSTIQGVARRGRPICGREVKIRLNLSVTPRSRFYLGLLAHLQKRSMSAVIEEFATSLSRIDRLGRDSKRKGQKALRGQSIYYEERKEPLNLSVTPTTKRILLELAANAAEIGAPPSISDLVERHCRCIAEAYEARFPYPGPRG